LGGELVSTRALCCDFAFVCYLVVLHFRRYEFLDPVVEVGFD
jgi:hypothetical protein